MTTWRDFLGELSGYKQLYEKTALELYEARQEIDELSQRLELAHDTIRKLELLVPRPPPPKITHTETKDLSWILHQTQQMGMDIVTIPLDATYYLTDQRNFLNIVAWDWTDTLPYIKDRFDCENFAFLFKTYVDLHFNLNQVAIIIDYQSAHSYNLVYYPDGNKQVLEPQTDALYVWTQRLRNLYYLEGAVALI